MTTPLTFRHTGEAGDIVYSLPVIRAFGGGVLYIKNDPGVTRPITPDLFNSLADLIKPQEYIHDVRWCDGQKVDYDFSLFRSSYRPMRTLAMSQARYLGLDRHFDTWTPWIKTSPVPHGYPVFARSPRYHNPAWDAIWPEMVAKYPDAFFVGTKEERDVFEQRFGGGLKHFPTKTFGDLAKIIAGASVFVGNQSAPYAIAEAMKVNTIQETWDRHRDCVFARPNAMYLATHKEWETIRDNPPQPEGLILALQFHPAMVPQAEALLRLLCDIEQVKRHDVEFCLSARRDVGTDDMDRLQRLAETKFAVVHRILGRRAGTGWPAGPNDMWAETTTRMSIARREGKTSMPAMLTFEPDCVPLCANWIDRLKAAWVRASGHGKDCCGHQETEKDHINGNGIFRVGIQIKHPALYGCGGDEGWDCQHGHLLLKIGEDAPEIFQRYQWDNYTYENILGIRKHGKVPALFHGTKGMNGIAFVRRMLESGELQRRAIV